MPRGAEHRRLRALAALRNVGWETLAQRFAALLLEELDSGHAYTFEWFPERGALVPVARDSLLRAPLQAQLLAQEAWRLARSRVETLDADGVSIGALTRLVATPVGALSLRGFVVVLATSKPDIDLDALDAMASIAGLQFDLAEAQLSRDLLEKLPLSVVYSDDTLIVRYANEAALRRLGAQRGQLVGLPIDLLTQDLRHRRDWLEESGRLPCRAEFTFGGETLSVWIDPVDALLGQRRGYLATWDDNAERSTPDGASF